MINIIMKPKRLTSIYGLHQLMLLKLFQKLQISYRQQIRAIQDITMKMPVNILKSLIKLIINSGKL